MKIVVTNTALANTGDAAIMLGTAMILRRAFGNDVSFSLRDQQPDEVRERYPEFDIGPVLFDRLLDWLGPRLTKIGVGLLFSVLAFWHTPLRRAALLLLPRAIRRDLDTLAAADLLVSAGGTYFVPHYRTSPKLVDLMAAAVVGTPYILFTQSLGPFPRKGGWLLKAVLRRARMIIVRDRPSRVYLMAAGVKPERIFECADAAFALMPSGRVPPRRSGPFHVAISVRHWPHFDGGGDGEAEMARYRRAIAELVRHLVENRRARVTFISTCQGVDAYWTDDSRVAEAIVGTLPEAVRRRTTIDPAFHRPEDLTTVFGNCDMVVATRMHAAILALVAGVPVLPIAYEFKTRELFTRLGFGDLVTDMDGASGAELCRKTDGIFAHRNQLREEIGECVTVMRWSAFAAGRHVSGNLGHAL